MPRDFQAGQFREHQVQQDEVRLVGPEPLERGPPVGGLDDHEAVGLQGFRQSLSQGRLVLDHEDRSRHAIEDTDNC